MLPLTRNAGVQRSSRDSRRNLARRALAELDMADLLGSSCESSDGDGVPEPVPFVRKRLVRRAANATRRSEKYATPAGAPIRPAGQLASRRIARLPAARY